MRVRYTYDKIERTAWKRVRCTVCRRMIQRQKTFMQTLNPFNVHELTKLPKDRMQIIRELNDEGDLWKLKPETCSKCKTKEDSNERQPISGGVGEVDRDRSGSRYGGDRRQLPDDEVPHR